MNSIYHTGELEIQRLAGQEAMAQHNQKIISPRIITGAFPFIEQQSWAIISSEDSQSRIWTSVLMGKAGFIHILDDQHLSIDIEHIQSTSQDILFNNLIANRKLGMLFIELPTRKRYRINGSAELMDNRIHITVEEAYPNCPKYIQRRTYDHSSRLDHSLAQIEKGTQLTPYITQWIQAADTLFVGSKSPEGHYDASHRGGNSGFVELLSTGMLKIPDYSGNGMFNTLGNLRLVPNAGLLFIDFSQGKTLQLTGETEILFNQSQNEDLKKSGGTGRFWLFEPRSWIISHHHHKANWQFMDYSPFNP